MKLCCKSVGTQITDGALTKIVLECLRLSSESGQTLTTTQTGLRY